VLGLRGGKVELAGTQVSETAVRELYR
jgi:hypothetical protein